MLTPIELPTSHHAPPTAAAAELFAEADRRIEEFVSEHRPLIHNFVVCDFRAVNTCLDWIVKNHLAAGCAFCEWGSGFGIVTMLAALHEFDACGIEVEDHLVDQARQLAEDLEISAQFAQGSLIPDDGDSLVEYLEDIAHMDTDSPGGYDELGLDVDDFDLLFAFPWPGEERYWNKLFDHYAADGALLLTYHGMEDLRLQRRVSGRR